jgi:hypothetical protein
MRRALLSVTLLILATGARAQRIVGPQPTSKHAFSLIGMAREEWDKNLFGEDAPDRHRRRGRLLPRIDLSTKLLEAGIGGDFNYSSDKNTELAVDAPQILPDNYDSRSARLDLAFLRLKPLSWVKLEGGRFEMPVLPPEILWDSDLRPQGGALTVGRSATPGKTYVSLTGLAARGSHVFRDEKTNMVLVSGTLGFPGGPDSGLALTGSYLTFTDFNKPDALDPRLHRQNTLTADGLLAHEFRTVDIGARLYGSGSMLQLFADYCWNTALSEGNRGFTIGVALGSLMQSRMRWEYSYAKVDRDVTLAAYATDDYLWSTGWEGHRAELATRTDRRSSIHLIGQLQRFKDAPTPEERDHWVQRLRLEWRFKTD